MGVDFSSFHAAECAANLPPSSLLFAKLTGQQLTTEGMVNALLLGITGEDGGSSGIDGVETSALPLEEFNDWYKNTAFKEVDSWQIA